MDIMIGSVSNRFSDLVVAGEHIENFLKNSKIQGAVITSNGAKKPYSDFQKKNEGETNATTVAKGKVIAYQVPYY